MRRKTGMRSCTDGEMLWGSTSRRKWSAQWTLTSWRASSTASGTCLTGTTFLTWSSKCGISTQKILNKIKYRWGKFLSKQPTVHWTWETGTTSRNMWRYWTCRSIPMNATSTRPFSTSRTTSTPTHKSMLTRQGRCSTLRSLLCWVSHTTGLTCWSRKCRTWES